MNQSREWPNALPALLTHLLATRTASRHSTLQGQALKSIRVPPNVSLLMLRGSSTSTLSASTSHLLEMRPVIAALGQSRMYSHDLTHALSHDLTHALSRAAGAHTGST